MASSGSRGFRKRALALTDSGMREKVKTLSSAGSRPLLRGPLKNTRLHPTRYQRKCAVLSDSTHPRRPTRKHDQVCVCLVCPNCPRSRRPTRGIGARAEEPPRRACAFTIRRLRWPIEANLPDGSVRPTRALPSGRAKYCCHARARHPDLQPGHVRSLRLRDGRFGRYSNHRPYALLISSAQICASRSAPPSAACTTRARIRHHRLLRSLAPDPSMLPSMRLRCRITRGRRAPSTAHMMAGSSRASNNLRQRGLLVSRAAINPAARKRDGLTPKEFVNWVRSVRAHCAAIRAGGTACVLSSRPPRSGCVSGIILTVYERDGSPWPLRPDPGAVKITPGNKALEFFFRCQT